MVPADSRRISRVPRYSGAVCPCFQVFAYGALTRCGRPFQTVPLTCRHGTVDGPTTPAGASPHRRFGLLRVRSPLLAQSLLLSFPPGTEMFQFPGLASRFNRDAGIASGGLPHSDIRVSKSICLLTRLFAACHVLLRLREPRHPSCALLSFPCVFRRKPRAGVSSPASGQFGRRYLRLFCMLPRFLVTSRSSCD